VGLVVETVQEAVVALGLDLGFLKAVDVGMLVGPVLVDEGYLSLNLGLGLVWLLLPGSLGLGQVFLRCLDVVGLRILLSLEDFVDSVQGPRLRYLIRILKSLHLGLGLEVALVLVVGLPCLLKREVLGLDENPDDAAGALAKRPCLSLGSEMVAICGEQVSPGVCSRPFKEQGGVPVLQGQGRRMVISPLPKIKGCT